jgi:hypothetical protein
MNDSGDKEAYRIAPDYILLKYDIVEPKIQRAIMKFDSDLILDGFDHFEKFNELNWQDFKQALNIKIDLSSFSATEMFNFKSIYDVNDYIAK